LVGPLVGARRPRLMGRIGAGRVLRFGTLAFLKLASIRLCYGSYAIIDDVSGRSLTTLALSRHGNASLIPPLPRAKGAIRPGILVEIGLMWFHTDSCAIAAAIRRVPPHAGKGAGGCLGTTTGPMRKARNNFSSLCFVNCYKSYRGCEELFFTVWPRKSMQMYGATISAVHLHNQTKESKVHDYRDLRGSAAGRGGSYGLSCPRYKRLASAWINH
jgi:hypothetical protein